MVALRTVAPLALLSLAACARGALPQATSPAAPPAPAEVSSSERPGDELDRAEESLFRALGVEVGDDAAAPRAKKESEREEASPSAGGDSDESERCALACRALGSMRRATEHICAMDADGDARCEAARLRVATAESRVVAACSGCGS